MVDNKVFVVGVVALLVIGGMFAVNLLVQVSNDQVTGAMILSKFKVNQITERNFVAPVLGPCTYDSDCRSGYYCRPYYNRLSERCMLGKALEGQTCNNNGDCESGFYCDVQRGNERTHHTWTCLPVTAY